jgi:hypothetical protein
MVVALHVFTPAKRNTEELLIKATTQNEENLNTECLVLQHIKYEFKPVHDGWILEFCNTEHLLFPDVPKLKKSPLIETTQLNKLAQGYFSLCSWILYVSHCSTMHQDAQMLPFFTHRMYLSKFLNICTWLAGQDCYMYQFLAEQSVLFK